MTVACGDMGLDKRKKNKIIVANGVSVSESERVIFDHEGMYVFYITLVSWHLAHLARAETWTLGAIAW